MRTLRGWDLVSPANARAARAERGLPFPGGEAGAIAEGVALLFAGIGWFAMRRGLRRLLPIVMAPVLFTIESATVFGDRGLRAWVAPLVVIATAVGAVAVFDLRRRESPQLIESGA